MATTPVQMVPTLAGSSEYSNGFVLPWALSASSVTGSESSSAPISSTTVSTAPMKRMTDWITSVQITAAMPPSIV